VAVNSNIVRVINAVNNTHPRGLMVTTWPDVERKRRFLTFYPSKND
jgi:hypothetical protein